MMKARYCIVILLILKAIYLDGQELLVPEIKQTEFEKIYLDDQIAYIDRASNKVLTRKEYLNLENHNLSLVGDDFPYEYWDTSQVNAYKNYTLEYPFLLQFEDTIYRAPVDHEMVVTSRFGRRRRGPHRGIDVDLVVGDSVRCLLPGKVRFVGYSSGHGKTVVVRHENDLETVYAHLSEYHVNVNDNVNKGDCLGLGGETGNARGSHLHLEVRYKGVCINPEYLMDFSNPHIFRDSLWVTKGLVDPLRHSSYSKGRYEVLYNKELASGYDKRAQRVYVVRNGDTLWAIARKNGMTVNQLVAMNRKKISAKSTLRIGQHIIISP
jgi:murein DD-endopeptidase MepM/ murein hydrolase activator NlpD